MQDLDDLWTVLQPVAEGASLAECTDDALHLLVVRLHESLPCQQYLLRMIRSQLFTGGHHPARAFFHSLRVPGLTDTKPVDQTCLEAASHLSGRQRENAQITIWINPTPSQPTAQEQVVGGER